MPRRRRAEKSGANDGDLEISGRFARCLSPGIGFLSLWKENLVGSSS